jgi:aminomethyltransferase
MATAGKKTGLHPWHVGHGANMAEFGGYTMPLWYPAGAKHEHLSVLLNAGLFDTSHMALVAVGGPGAFELLQRCFSKDLSDCIGRRNEPLPPGRCVYGVFLNERGEVIDDSIVYRLSGEDFLVVVNAGMGAAIAQHLGANSGSRSVRIEDLTDRVGKLDIQGPTSARVLGRILKEPAAAFAGMVYFSFRGHFDRASSSSGAVQLSDGTPVLLSRTGYTGEFGFELFLPPERLPAAWEMILAAGRDAGIAPCGLAARDSLRAGAVLPLSHQDIGAWPFANNPWLFALPFAPDRRGFTKAFIGAEALLNLDSAEHTLPFVGGDPRKVATGDPATVLGSDGREIGRVLTCATDMGIGRHGERIFSIASPDRPAGFEPKGLSCGFVRTNRPLAVGDRVGIQDNRRRLQVTIVADIRPDRTARKPIAEML